MSESDTNYKVKLKTFWEEVKYDNGYFHMVHVCAFVRLMFALPDKSFNFDWDKLEEEDIEDGVPMWKVHRFHKSFRQSDMFKGANSGHLDMAVWDLMQSDDVYKFLYKFIEYLLEEK